MTVTDLIRDEYLEIKMRLREFLKEETKFRNNQREGVPDYLMKKAKESISKRLKVDPKFLKFYAVSVPGWKNKVYITFNVTDKNHPKYRSTVEYEVEDKDK